MGKKQVEQLERYEETRKLHDGEGEPAGSCQPCHLLRVASPVTWVYGEVPI